MSRIYWDTMLFVYWLEDHPVYARRVQEILEEMQERQDTLCTSAFTVGEVLVGPYRKHATQVAGEIQDFFNSGSVAVIPYTVKTADLYARIRSQAGVSPADAIHLACASEYGTDVFLTNDKNLAGKVIPGIQFVVGLNTNLF